MQKTFTIDIDQARNLINVRELAQWLKSLKPGKWELEATDLRKRSPEHNGYYWGVVVKTCQHALYQAGWEDITTPQACHEFLKATHLTTIYKNRYSLLTLPVPRTTTKLTIGEFTEYINNICAWALEYFNLYIPAPNEVLREYEEWEKDLWNGNEIRN